MSLHKTASSDPGSTLLAGGLDEIYETYEPMVERWVRRLGGPFADVEDLIHDVFMVVLRRRNEFRGEAKVSTWLFRITQNVVRKRRWRDRVRGLLGGRYVESERIFTVESRTPLDDVERAQEVRRLYRALDRLPEAQRTAIILYDIDQLSAADVAGLLGIEENAVWVRVHRARAQLRKELGR